MEFEAFRKENRTRDPFQDRRSGEDRRIAYDLDYFPDGGLEKRNSRDRRQAVERRQSCIRVSKWSSVCPDGEK